MSQTRKRCGEILVKDAIYRFIKVPPLCRAYMDTPEFQRLRRISQLGNVQYVYPSATHTRFSHSLGVMHLAGKQADALGIQGREKELVQLAGLMHDVGHLAFSHLMEEVILDKTHEERSVDIFLRVSDRIPLVTYNERAAVVCMIQGKIYGNLGLPCLYEIVCNARLAERSLDVDRMDYLQRDAHFTGMPGFQPDYIIEQSYVDDEGHIAYEAKANGEIQALLETRNRMYDTVYRHPTVGKINRFFVALLERMGLDDKDPLTLTDGGLLSEMYDEFPMEMEDLDIRRMSGPLFFTPPASPELSK